MNPKHFHNYIILPTLEFIDSRHPAAPKLILGTCLVESDLTYVQQLGGGPARGFNQMEKVTFDDIWSNFLVYRPDLEKKVRKLTIRGLDLFDQMHCNMALMVAMTRVHYYRVSDPLPKSSNIEGLAEYWKQWYNTSKGKGEVEDFMRHRKTLETV
jgi:hypothetical protein